MERHIAGLSDAELKAEFKRLRDNLCDIEDMHAYANAKTSVHIGGATARKMQEEFDEECRAIIERIAELEEELRARGID
jgi:hypothetical protein